MVLTLDLVLMLVGLACFGLSACSVPTGRLNTTAGGLFLWLLSVVV